MHSWGDIARRIRVPLGFVFAIVYVWLARPSRESLLLGAAICVPGLALRALASGHVQKNTCLTTTGPYACTRNPLYLGSLVLAAGFAVAARSLSVAVAIVALFLAVYLPVVLAEERFLRLRFPEFAEYERRVPRFVPRWAPTAARQGKFSSQLYWKHQEYNALLGAVAMMAALAVKMVWFR
ncbi:MAG TPA: isoprenylcysteine carboxylmethyltransferase family protein [Terriglobales bacterium]|nr:isoprenylcysteine carboxylmethyltransferase family protein [Terriglobales bacterium]